MAWSSPGLTMGMEVNSESNWEVSREEETTGTQGGGMRHSSRARQSTGAKKGCDCRAGKGRRGG
jgi:hypothetical protein